MALEDKIPDDPKLPEEVEEAQELEPELPEKMEQPDQPTIPDEGIQSLAPEVELPENFGEVPDNAKLPPFTEIIRDQEFPQGLPKDMTLDDIRPPDAPGIEEVGQAAIQEDDKLDQILVKLQEIEDKLEDKLENIVRIQEEKPEGYGP
jgi:hypothetical protein